MLLHWPLIDRLIDLGLHVSFFRLVGGQFVPRAESRPFGGGKSGASALAEE